MANKYVCMDCGHVFESEDFLVSCPKCGSTNIGEKKKKSKALLWIILTLLLLAGLGGGAYWYFFMKPDGEKKEATSKKKEKSETIAADNNKQEDAVDTVLPVDPVPYIVDIQNPVAVNGKYDLEVDAATHTNDKLEYILTDPTNPKNSYTSKDGKFTGVNPSTDASGVYELIIRNTKTMDELSLPVTGFEQLIVKVKKITKDELQRIFNSGTAPADMNSRMVPGCKIKVIGLPDGEPAPDRVSEIFNRLEAIWESVVVESVEYDERDRMSSFRIRVIE